MAGWVKLFGSIVTSSVWCENDKTLRVWIAFLALSDSEGRVEGAVPGLANVCRVTPDEMRAALVRLSSPDPDSRTPDHEGRRIEAIPGGWLILNYRLYRERGQAKEGSRAPYMRKRRAEATALLPDVTRYTEERGEKREAEQKTDSSAIAAGRSLSLTELRVALNRDDDAVTVMAYWLERTGKKLRSPKVHDQILSRIKARLRDGCSTADLKASVDFALSDPHYVQNGYARQADVIWRSAERVQNNADRLASREPRAARDDGPSDEELDAIANGRRS